MGRHGRPRAAHASLLLAVCRLCGRRQLGAQGKTLQYHAITNNKGVTGEQGALKGALHNAIEVEQKLCQTLTWIAVSWAARALARRCLAGIPRHGADSCHICGQSSCGAAGTRRRSPAEPGGRACLRGMRRSPAHTGDALKCPSCMCTIS